MEVLDANPTLPRKRHGCVTAWLVFMIVVNSLVALMYFFLGDMIRGALPVEISSTMMILLGLIGAANVVFAVLLLKWKKIAFWGFVGTSLAALAINLTLELGIGQSLGGIAGIAILYGILQIKENGVSAWDNME